MGDDVDQGLRSSWLGRGELANEVDEPDQRLAVGGEGPIVQVIVAEDPDRAARSAPVSRRTRAMAGSITILCPEK